ncbi:MAG TPA: PLP-dependent aspartate aminotransferase family protein [Dermatophilaceae bacterium]|nr:PLP-dependent aspartate aminotransferase family protein [Dermatophilaceae bacterium]
MSDLDTSAVHAGREDLPALGAHVPPIDLSSTYPLPDVDRGGRAYDGMAHGYRPASGDSLIYQRLWNPNVDRFERAMARLEDCDEAVAFASGMAALSAVLLACVAAGKPHVVALRPLYGGSDHLLASGLLGTSVSWARVQTLHTALRPDTGLVILETPGNPSLDLVDIADVVDRAMGVPVLVDSTFATPVLQQPSQHGASLVLHSATKFIGGHGDALGGVVAAPAAWVNRLRQVRAVTGAVLHPMAAYQLHRGLQTLPVRVRAAQASAIELAKWLAGHRDVERVHYPGLNDPSGLVGRQMSGPGAILAFAPRGGPAVAEAVPSACRLIGHAVSLGGVDTLIQHPAALTHRVVEPSARPSADLLRLSVGLEDPADLRADLEQALQLARAQARDADAVSAAGSGRSVARSG